jgi:uncharacterized protein (DUF58 family)
MSYRLVSNVFFAAGFLLLGLAAYFYFPQTPGAGLETGDTEIEVADCLAGADTPVVFHLENRSGAPMRVLGIGTC